MSVQYCLCVSRIQCTQCSASVYSVSSVLQRSMQVAFSLQHQFGFLSVQSIAQRRVCSIHSQWCPVLAGLQSTVFMVCLPLFSVGSVQSGWYSVVSGVPSIAFSVSSVSVAFRVCIVQWVILCLYSSVSAVFRALAVHQESVIFMSCSESTL